MNGRIVIKNGYVLTMNPSKEELVSDVLIDNDTISDIGANIARQEGDTVLDAAGKIVAPGFVQSHVHLCQTLFRGLANDKALMDWIDIIMPLESCHDDESAYLSAQLAICELLSKGTTAINDMGTSKFHMATANAVQDCGIRAQLGRTIMDSKWTADYLRHDTDLGLSETVEFIERWQNKSELITCGIPIRWILNISDESLRGVREIAMKYNIPIHTHANENMEECRYIEKEKGMSAIAYFHQFGLTDCKMQMAHCIYVNEEERSLLKKHNVSVLHCPSCNCKAASGIAPVTSYISEQINVSLGSDTAACNDNLDMFQEMRLAGFLQKLKEGPCALPAGDIFALASSGGAEALGLQNKIGTLEVGKKADIIVIKPSVGNIPFHEESIYSSLVYAGNGRDVDTTIVNGKILYREGRFVSLDFEKLKLDCEKAVKRVTERARNRGLYR